MCGRLWTLPNAAKSQFQNGGVGFEVRKTDAKVAVGLLNNRQYGQIILDDKTYDANRIHRQTEYQCAAPNSPDHLNRQH